MGDYPDILEDYLHVSRKRHKNATAIAKLQMHLLEDLAVQEQAIKHYKAKCPTEPKEKQFIESQIFHHRLISNTVRHIRDGIAWRSFGYDRSIPRILAEHPVKHVVLSLGVVAELHEWSSIFFQASRTAIINAVTNCIGIGDVTAIDEDGSVELIEVKSGKTKSSRKIRQKNQLRDAAGILGTGVGTIEGKLVKVASMPITPTSYLVELRTLLEQCGSEGWSSALIAPHCYVECVDFRKLGQREDMTPKMKAAHQRCTEKWDDDDKISVMSSMDIITFSPNIAPFSIFPFDERMCVELAIGAKQFRTYLNATEVFKEFEASGWTIESSLGDAIDQTNGEAVVILKKEGFVCHLPPGDFGKLQFEMLSPATLIEECEYIRGLGPKVAEGYGIWTFDGEARQWN
ncbi:MAG TPA: hypothetical protein VN948_14315 [Terriglobales bacterium]|nr:hypothetical protein [Terriglobales bacterium]